MDAGGTGAVVLGVKVDFLWDDTAAKEQFSAREKALWCTKLSLRPGAHLLVPPLFMLSSLRLVLLI